MKKVILAALFAISLFSLVNVANAACWSYVDSQGNIRLSCVSTPVSPWWWRPRPWWHRSGFRPGWRWHHRRHWRHHWHHHHH